MVEACIDTSVLIALLDPKDVWHEAALTLKDALQAQAASVAIFDCDFDNIGWLQRLTQPANLT